MWGGVLGAGRVEMEGGWGRLGFRLDNWPYAKIPITGEEKENSANPKALATFH